MSTLTIGSDRRLWFDLGLACLVPAIQLVLLSAAGVLRPWGYLTAATVGLVLLQGLPLVARRSHPWAVFAVVLVGNSLYYALGLPPTGYDLGLAAALFTLAEHRDLRQSMAGYGLVVGETLIMKVLAIGPYWSRAPWFLVTYLWVFFGAAWLSGRYQRVRAHRLRELLDRARRDQQEAAAAATRAERTRIARELHDVIAHHLSLMVIQAGGARRLAEQDPARAREALTVIEEYGRRGLQAMPGLLRALRTDSEKEDRAPSPRLADLPALLEELGRSGLPVTLTVHGTPRPAPDEVELSAYRIVQEALTNVIRHADRAPTRVHLSYRPDDLVVEVVDTGPGAADGPIGDGHGIAGMRERVMLLGGTWEFGEAPTGGCRVRATLPCPSNAP